MAMDQDELCERLAAAGICQGFGEAEIRALAAAGTVEEVYMDSLIMKEGEPSHSMVIFLTGEAAVLKDGENGQTHELATVGAGAILGEVGLLESVPRTATVKALSPVRYFLLERESFQELVKERDPAALELSLAIARCLALRLRKMSQEVVSLYETSSEPGGGSGKYKRDLLASTWNI